MFEMGNFLLPMGRVLLGMKEWAAGGFSWFWRPDVNGRRSGVYRIQQELQEPHPLQIRRLPH